jgi:hypothetical protein
MPAKVTTLPKQIRAGIAIEGFVRAAVTHRLNDSNTKQTNETSNVLRDTNPLEVNRKGDTNTRITKMIVRNSKILTRYSLIFSPK